VNVFRRVVAFRPGRYQTVAGSVLAVALVLGGLSGGSTLTASVAAEARAGQPVPAAQVAMIARASMSCPSLTPARLAGQLMAASAFRGDASEGVAGLSDAEWQKWAPGPSARRDDPAASITALAHLTCDFVGKLRRANVQGDLWKPAVAARRVGVAAVRSAGGVPDESADHVQAVTGYAAYYDQPRDPDSAPGSPEGGGLPAGNVAPKPVPAELVPLVVSAGQQCPAVTAPLIAAQLMAASGFETDLRGDDGALGVAQFRPVVWSRYSGAGRSPADEAVAIPAMASAMCGLTASIDGLTTDTYRTAVKAFHGAADGKSDAEDAQRANRILIYAQYYGEDSRLLLATGPDGGDTNLAAPPPAQVAATPTPAPPPPVKETTATPPAKTATTTATTTGTRAGKPTTAAKTPSTPRTTTATTPAVKTYAIQAFGDKCVDSPKAADGTGLRIMKCNGSAGQKWQWAGDGSLRNRGLCMDLAWAATGNGTKVQVANCNGGWAQRFTVNAAHDLVNTEIGKCVDIKDKKNAAGTALQLWDCAGTSNQKFTRVG
jgi:hypothetical protein